MLLLMEKMCRRGQGTKASRSRVTNLVAKTYSRVALVDQTGPIMVAPLEWRSCLAIARADHNRLLGFPSMSSLAKAWC